MIKALFWDNDGILVDTEKLYFQATAEALQTVGIELTREDFIDISLTQGQSVFVLAERQGFASEKIKVLQDQRNKRYCELLATDTKPIEGIRTVLEKLHGHFMMGIVTSSRGDHFDIIHRNTGLLPFFDFILKREDYGLSKPHPEPYLTALEKTGLQPEECVVIEDSERGYRAAVAAGIPCLAIPGDLTRNSDFSSAWHILDSAAQIPPLVLPTTC